MEERNTLIEIASHIRLKHPDMTHNDADFKRLLVSEFPAFRPMNGGSVELLGPHVMVAIKQIFPLLNGLLESLGETPADIRTTSGQCVSTEHKILSDHLGGLFQVYGSDKSTLHDYHHFYASILCKNAEVRNIFEIGLGTNDTSLIGTMGSSASPGGSLRAFRDFCPNAMIYGADIDRQVLFSEERISTFYVDQTDSASFQEILSHVPVGGFDLVIDDGLHSPNANIATLIFGLSLLKRGGWIVIEDIGENALAIWRVVESLLKSQYRCCLLRDKIGMFLFAVQKVC